jgi:hypothetical protein
LARYVSTILGPAIGNSSVDGFTPKGIAKTDNSSKECHLTLVATCISFEPGEMIGAGNIGVHKVTLTPSNKKTASFNLCCTQGLAAVAYDIDAKNAIAPPITTITKHNHKAQSQNNRSQLRYMETIILNVFNHFKYIATNVY